jgi:hypothetical protein
VPLKVMPRFFDRSTFEGKHLMSPEYMEGRRSDRLPNVTGMWLEGRLPLPSMNLIAALESSFDGIRLSNCTLSRRWSSNG